MPTPDTKYCIHCQQQYLVSGFSKDRNSKDGLQRYCKSCQRSFNNASYRAAHLEESKRRTYIPEENKKWCSRCSAWKPLNGFYLMKHTVTGYAAYCIPCHKEAVKKEAAANKSRVNATQLRYREAHRADALASLRKWKHDNPDRAKALSTSTGSRRRARERGVSGSHTVAEWEWVKAVNGHLCLMCRQPETADAPLTRDHIVPISKGGTDNIGNIQPLCRRCNTRKLDKTLDLRGSTPKRNSR